MGSSSRMTDDDGLANFLQELVDGGHLSGAALGITKLVVDKGTDVLSPAQRSVFDGQVIGTHTTKSCSRCGCPIPWSEMYASLDNGRLCNYCWHMTTKED